MSVQSSCSKNYSSMPDSSGRSKLGDEVFAQVIATGTSAELKFFDQKIKQFQDDGKIPELDQKVEYSIYRWKSGVLPHESIVVGYDEKFFTLEISFVNKILTLYATAVDNNNTAWKYCESIITTGEELISKAVKVFESMDGYNLICKNCQDFVNLLLVEIGLPDKVRMTDSVRLVMAGVVGAAAAVVSFFLKNKTLIKTFILTIISYLA